MYLWLLQPALNRACPDRGKLHVGWPCTVSCLSFNCVWLPSIFQRICQLWNVQFLSLWSSTINLFGMEAIAIEPIFTHGLSWPPVPLLAIFSTAGRTDLFPRAQIQDLMSYEALIDCVHWVSRGSAFAPSIHTYHLSCCLELVDSHILGGIGKDLKSKEFVLFFRGVEMPSLSQPHLWSLKRILKRHIFVCCLRDSVLTMCYSELVVWWYIHLLRNNTELLRLLLKRAMNARAFTPPCGQTCTETCSDP